MALTKKDQEVIAGLFKSMMAEVAPADTGKDEAELARERLTTFKKKQEGKAMGKSKVIVTGMNETVQIASDLITLCMQSDAIETDKLGKACELITESGILELDDYEEANKLWIDVLSSATTIPEFGISRSTGESIRLRKRGSGEVKLNQWKATNAMFVQGQDIIRSYMIVKKEKSTKEADKLIFPGGHLVSRGELKKIEKDHTKKTPEAIEVTIERFLKGVLSKVKDAKKRDKKKIDRLLIKYNDQINKALDEV